MIDDVTKLLREQTRINRMQHPSAAAHAVVQLEMTKVIPCHGANTGVGTGSQAVQHITQTPCARESIGKTITMAFMVSGHGYNFALAVVALGVAR